jgi:hypothetical protein
VVLRNVRVLLSFLDGLGGTEEFEGCGGEGELFGGWFLGGQADELAADAALELLEVAGGLGEDGSETRVVVFFRQKGKCNVQGSNCAQC